MVWPVTVLGPSVHLGLSNICPLLQLGAPSLCSWTLPTTFLVCVCVGGIFLFPLSCFPCLFALVCPLAVRCRLSFPCGRAMYMLRCETVSLSSHCYQVQDVCISGFVLSDAVSLSCMPELQVLYFWFCICVLDFHFLFMEQMPRTICL